MAELVYLPAGRQARQSHFMYYVYAIKSRIKNYIYVGLTNNLERRIKEHNNKKESTTKPCVPFDILTTEEFKTRIEARKREKYLKSGFGREYLKSL